MISDDFAVADVVKDVWAKILPYVPFDPELTWFETGIDSLKSMEFVLHVERALGAKVDVDLMAREATVGAFIRGLNAPAPRPAEGVPFFLVPGMYGDEPRLTPFRTSLRGRVWVETLRLPDIQDSTALLRDLEATAAYVTAQVIERQPKADIYIGGYSFGAHVAQAAARRLEAAGRRVALLCILDGHRGLAPADISELRRPLLERITFLDSAHRRRLDWALILFRVLVRCHAWPLARRFLLAIAHRADPRWLQNRRARLLGLLRDQAVRACRPAPCPAPHPDRRQRRVSSVGGDRGVVGRYLSGLGYGVRRRRASGFIQAAIVAGSDRGLVEGPGANELHGHGPGRPGPERTRPFAIRASSDPWLD